MTPADLLTERYATYLLERRGLCRSSVRNYVNVAREFFAERERTRGELALEELDPAAVSAFVLREVRRSSVGSAKCSVTRLRSLLRFLHVEGEIGRDLAGAVPRVGSWRLASLVKALDAGEVARLLESCDQSSAVGNRDFAVLKLLARLGLRAGEVTALRLRDIDWRAGEMTIRGKSARQEQLPLPADVGAALTGWVRLGRPRCGHPFVFTRVHAPHDRLSTSAVTGLVGRACKRAGFSPVGAHRLRHTAATEMLRAGASLSDVGQVLRHRTPDSVDLRKGRPRRARRRGPAVARGRGMSDLQEHLERYLALRRGLGFKLVNEGRLLADFIAFADAAGEGTITIEAALRWARLPTGGCEAYLSQRLRAVRGFARYLHPLDPATEVPPLDLLPARRHRPAPYLYSEHDVLALLAAARGLRPSLRAASGRR